MRCLFGLPLWLALMSPCAAQQEAPLKETPGAFSKYGYRTVAEALEGLKRQPGATVEVTKPDGWTIVTQPEPDYAIWSFTPAGHYAHPAVVRRGVVEANGSVSVRMNALCEADKASCDRLIREFQALNAKMRDDVRSRGGMDPGK